MPYFVHAKTVNVPRTIEMPANLETPYAYDVFVAECSDYLRDHVITVHDSPADANAEKLKRDRETGEPHAVTFYATQAQIDSWQAREQTRLEDGTYLPLPFSLPYQLHDHFAHLSKKFPGKIAYTKNDEHGIADRQTVVRPGKYLIEFLCNESETARSLVSSYSLRTKAQIDEMIAQCSAENLELKIAETADEAITVYTNGPRSCMSRPSEAYQGHVHPAAVYAGEFSDLRVAYDGDLDGTIRARCVVWPAKMRAVRVYPANSALTFKLKHAGYEVFSDNFNEENPLEGARIAAISDRNGNGWITPYVDGNDSGYVTADKRSIVIGSRRSGADYYETVSLQQTQEWRGDTIAAGVSEPYENDDDSESYDFTCERCDGNFMDDDRDSRDSSLCTSCADNVFYTCDQCDGEHDRRDTNPHQVTDNGRRRHVCHDCYQNRTTCDHPDCRTVFYSDDGDNHGENDDLCESCADQYRVCEHCNSYTDANDDESCEHCDGSDRIVASDDTETLPLPLAQSQIDPSFSDDTTIYDGYDNPIAYGTLDKSLYRLLRLRVDGDQTYRHCSFGHADHPAAGDFDRVFEQFANLAKQYPETVYLVVFGNSIIADTRINGVCNPCTSETTTEVSANA